jgi:hypothetical protein
VEEIIDGPDCVRYIQIVVVNSRDLCAHAQEAVSQIQVIVSTGAHVEFDRSSARQTGYGMILDECSTLDTRLRGRYRKQVEFALKRTRNFPRE